MSRGAARLAHHALLAAGVYVVTLAFASGAEAQAPAVHGGVDLAAIVPDGMHVVDVVVPDRAEIPVRIALGSQADGPATLILDVTIAADSAVAAETLDWQLATVQGDVPALVGLGDRAYADAGFVAFVRDNVAVVLRRVRGGQELRSIAARIDRAILRSPAGPTRARIDVQLPVPSAMRPGDVVSVALPAAALDARVTASGDISARRTQVGYLVTRTGRRTGRLGVIVVDRRLRTSF